MPVICPTVTAYGEEDYKAQVNKVAHLATRVHIDLTDGVFTKERTVAPEQAWWPVGVKADFHLMYKNPAEAVRRVLEHQPNLVIIHAEAEGDFMLLADLCHGQNVKVGIALLQSSPAEKILPALQHIDSVLIFSGNLGYQGGSYADPRLLEKVQFLKAHEPGLEIGWDGGISDQNVAELVNGGVEVLNVGGFIQKADDPSRAFQSLQRIADETGTT